MPQDTPAERYMQKQMVLGDLSFIATKCKNYTDAVKYMREIKSPELIRVYGLNFPAHYKLAKCAISIYYTHQNVPATIDTLKHIISSSTNLSDSLANILYVVDAYEYLQLNDSATKYKTLYNTINSRFANQLTESQLTNAVLNVELEETALVIKVAFICWLNKLIIFEPKFSVTSVSIIFCKPESW